MFLTFAISNSTWLAVAPIGFGYAHAPVKLLAIEKGETNERQHKR
jgi:hypothetical protein